MALKRAYAIFHSLPVRAAVVLSCRLCMQRRTHTARGAKIAHAARKRVRISYSLPCVAAGGRARVAWRRCVEASPRAAAPPPSRPVLPRAATLSSLRVPSSDAQTPTPQNHSIPCRRPIRRRGTRWAAGGRSTGWPPPGSARCSGTRTSGATGSMTTTRVRAGYRCSIMLTCGDKWRGARERGAEARAALADAAPLPPPLSLSRAPFRSRVQLRDRRKHPPADSKLRSACAALGLARVGGRDRLRRQQNFSGARALREFGGGGGQRLIFVSILLVYCD